MRKFTDMEAAIKEQILVETRVEYNEQNKDRVQNLISQWLDIKQESYDINKQDELQNYIKKNVK